MYVGISLVGVIAMQPGTVANHSKPNRTELNPSAPQAKIYFIFINLKPALRQQLRQKAAQIEGDRERGKGKAGGGGQRRSSNSNRSRRNRLETFRAPKRIFSWRKYFYVSFNVPKMAAVCLPACWHLQPYTQPPHVLPIRFGAPHGNPKVSGKLLGPRKTNLTRKVHGHFCSCYAKLVDLPGHSLKGRERERDKERERKRGRKK